MQWEYTWLLVFWADGRRDKDSVEDGLEDCWVAWNDERYVRLEDTLAMYGGNSWELAAVQLAQTVGPNSNQTASHPDSLYLFKRPLA